MPTELIKAYFTHGRILTEDSDPARELYNKSRFGYLQKDNRVQLSLIEVLYLL
jgi:tRNA splicing endonuclease